MFQVYIEVVLVSESKQGPILYSMAKHGNKLTYRAMCIRKVVVLPVKKLAFFSTEVSSLSYTMSPDERSRPRELTSKFCTNVHPESFLYQGFCTPYRV
jgi:hypothetical protein